VAKKDEYVQCPTKISESLKMTNKKNIAQILVGIEETSLDKTKVTFQAQIPSSDLKSITFEYDTLSPWKEGFQSYHDVGEQIGRFMLAENVSNYNLINGELADLDTGEIKSYDSVYDSLLVYPITALDLTLGDLRR
jgi:hypothetical protein